MGINFDKKTRLFCLQTRKTEYQFQINEIGILQHLYYGKKTYGFQNILLDRGFSGNPYECKMNRGMSLDVLPQEFSGCGVGDYRISSLSIIDHTGSRSL